MNIKQCVILVAQAIIILLTGIFTNDIWYSIGISIIGVIFNFLVSCNKPIGFIFGFVYAITNGVFAYYTKVYATFGFMIIMQAPMAIYSFVSWKKTQASGQPIMKKMNYKGFIIMIVSMAMVAVAMYFVLIKLNSSNVIVDLIFFVFSVTACLLLALRYKIAYIVTLFSGIGGTVLWIFQTISTKNGLSIAIFYAIVAINSCMAIFEQYIKKPKLAV